METNLSDAVAATTKDERFRELEDQVARISRGLGIMLQHQGLDEKARKVYPALPFMLAPGPIEPAALRPAVPTQSAVPASSSIGADAAPISPVPNQPAAHPAAAPSSSASRLHAVSSLAPPDVTIQPPTPPKFAEDHHHVSEGSQPDTSSHFDSPAF
jgi:hypothetical protein